MARKAELKTTAAIVTLPNAGGMDSVNAKAGTIMQKAFNAWDAKVRNERLATQGAAAGCAFYYDVLVARGEQVCSWEVYRTGSDQKAKRHLISLMIARFASALSKDELEKMDDFRRNAENVSTDAHRQCVRNGMALYAAFEKRGIDKSAFNVETGLWSVPTECFVEAGFRPIISLTELPMDGRRFTIIQHSPTGNETTKSTHASEKVFNKLNNPRAAQNRVDADKISTAAKMKPLADRLFVLLNPRDENAEAGWVPNIDDFEENDWNAAVKVAMFINEKMADPIFMTPRAKQAKATKAAAS